MAIIEMMFDPSVPGWIRPLTKREKQIARVERPKPFDIFGGDAKEKLRRISALPGADTYLKLAVEAVWYHFFSDKDEFNPFGPKYGLYEQRYVETRREDHRICDGVNDWLWDNTAWEYRLRIEPLHVCYTEFFRPLRDRIQELFEQEDQ